MENKQNDIIFYEDDNGKFKIEVLLENENVWLNVNSIAMLFDVQRPAIVIISMLTKNLIKIELVPLWNKFNLKELEK